MWCGVRGNPGQHRSLGHGRSGHISSISRLLGLVARADRRGAAGAAPVCCCATPVGGAGECTGVRAAVLRGVLVFAVGTAGSGVVAGSNRCSGGHCWWQVHWRGPRPLGCSRGYIARWSVALLHGIWVLLADVVTGSSVTSSSNDFNQVGSMGCLSDDGGG